MSTHQIGLPSILTLLAVLAAGVPAAGAQTVEITPVVVYRFGGAFSELVTHPLYTVAPGEIAASDEPFFSLEKDCAEAFGRDD